MTLKLKDRVIKNEVGRSIAGKNKKVWGKMIF